MRWIDISTRVAIAKIPEVGITINGCVDKISNQFNRGMRKVRFGHIFYRNEIRLCNGIISEGITHIQGHVKHTFGQVINRWV